MIHGTVAIIAIATACASAGAIPAPDSGDWPQWRGPMQTGMSSGDAPLTWNDSTNIRWTVDVPGRGFSSPIVVGDRIFLTTAVPTGKPSEQPESQGEGRGPGGGAGAGVEHRFDVLAVDRATGKTLWQRTATVAAPHEGYHRIYGSFASNSPATDGKRVLRSSARVGYSPMTLMGVRSGGRTSASSCGCGCSSAKELRPCSTAIA